MARWLKENAADADIVVSTRARLARNMAGVPFPHRIRGTAQARAVCRAATDAFLGGGQDFSCVVIRDLRPAQREYLTALHVISPELTALPDGEVIRSRDDAMSVMLLEEDHYRLQYLTGGFAPEVTAIRPEFVYGASRLDFCLETPRGPHLVEVKGVTLEENGNALFPDAPTERGVRHIRELQRAAADGLDATLFFVIQIEDIASVAPNDATQPAFGSALRDAAAHGVRVLAYDCDVAPDCLTIRREVPVIL